MTIYHVRPNGCVAGVGSDSSDGLSWATAKRTLNSVDATRAAAAGDIIKVAKTPDPVVFATGVDMTSGSRFFDIPAGIVKPIEQCDSGWVGVNGGLADHIGFAKQGSWSVRITTPVDTTANTLYAYKTLPVTLDLTSYQNISFWVPEFGGGYTAPAGIGKLCLCSDTTGTQVVDTFLLPETFVNNSLAQTTPRVGGGNLGSNINSIAYYSDNTVAGYGYLDAIVACNNLCYGAVFSHTPLYPTWAPNTDVTNGTVLCPTDSAMRTMLMRCVADGTTGAVEPEWPILYKDRTNSGTAMFEVYSENTAEWWNCFKYFEDYTSYVRVCMDTGVNAGANTGRGWSIPSGKYDLRYRTCAVEPMVAVSTSSFFPLKGGVQNALTVAGATQYTYRNSTSRTYAAQTFVAPGTAQVSIIGIFCAAVNVGTPSGNVWIDLYTDGTPGTGTLLGTSNRIPNTAFDDLLSTRVPFHFSTLPSITADSTYHFRLMSDSTISASNYIRPGYGVSNPYSNGSVWDYNGSSWVNNPTGDLGFSIVTTPNLGQMVLTGGWDTTTNTINGMTWYNGRNGYGTFMTGTSIPYGTIKNFGSLRFYRPLSYTLPTAAAHIQKIIGVGFSEYFTATIDNGIMHDCVVSSTPTYSTSISLIGNGQIANLAVCQGLSTAVLLNKIGNPIRRLRVSNCLEGFRSNGRGTSYIEDAEVSDCGSVTCYMVPSDYYKNIFFRNPIFDNYSFSDTYLSMGGTLFLENKNGVSGDNWMIGKYYTGQWDATGGYGGRGGWRFSITNVGRTIDSPILLGGFNEDGFPMHVQVRQGESCTASLYVRRSGTSIKAKLGVDRGPETAWVESSDLSDGSVNQWEKLSVTVPFNGTVVDTIYPVYLYIWDGESSTNTLDVSGPFMQEGGVAGASGKLNVSMADFGALDHGRCIVRDDRGVFPGEGKTQYGVQFGPSGVEYTGKNRGALAGRIGNRLFVG